MAAQAAKFVMRKNDVGATSTPAVTRLNVVLSDNRIRPSTITPAYHAQVSK
jgi:hypothetical protein